MAISLRRVEARAIRRLAILAQAINNTRLTRPMSIAAIDGNQLYVETSGRAKVSGTTTRSVARFACGYSCSS